MAVTNNHLLSNPASDLELPKLDKRLPKAVLTQSEIETILNSIDVSEPMGVRDRAILEVLYSTGMRRMEVINLRWDNIDTERGTIFIRESKGKVDRMVPIGERAPLWSRNTCMRRGLSSTSSVTIPACSLPTSARPSPPNRMTQLVRNHINAAEIGKSGSCHMFRHSCATLMLENGVDVRYIQQLLGHAKLDTTQIYTQVSIRQPKQVHTLTHPAKMKVDESESEPLEE